MLNVFVRRNYLAALRALEEGDLDALLKNFAPACELTFVGDGVLGADRLTGDDIRRWFERYLRLIPERSLQVERFASSGPLWHRQVAAHVLVRGRLADGTPYSNQFAHFLEVRKGRIMSDLVLEDTQAWARAAGGLTDPATSTTTPSPKETTSPWHDRPQP